MGSFLQIIGSIASIVGIPLAVYLFLRQREASHLKLRQEICKTLSYQLGEGRNLSHFEIEAVIEAKCREFNSKPGRISPNEVIEDLASQTISNPMLDSGRKEQILENLVALHSAIVSYEVFRKYNITARELIDVASHRVEVSPEDRKLIEAAEKAPDRIERVEISSALSSTFGMIAAITTAFIGLFASVTDIGDFAAKIVAINGELPKWTLGVLLGILSSITAAAITYLYKRESDHSKSKKKRTEHGAEQSASADAKRY
ncbi:MAG TPA: hypothetical protein VJ917_10465 [Saprospiraceae bacterium]|nr:hypothetical protein [Saprospiraceae bacterium]